MMEWKQSLEMLKEGNHRFVTQNLENKFHVEEDFMKMAKKQEPIALVLTCSDSRISPDIVFDQALGSLFIVKNAGNVLTDSVLGSMEYAVSELEVPLILVFGHYGCGAVTAAKAKVPPKEKALYDLVERIYNHVSQTDTIDEAVDMHATKTAREVRVALGNKVKVAAAAYHLDSGKIDWLDID